MTDVSRPPGSSPSQDGVAWYVYAVLPWCAEVPVTAGIEGGHPTVFIPEGPIMAAASPVSLAAFDSEPLRRNMEDPRWLTEKVCQHEAIVEAVMARSPVLPMKFCTIFRSPGAVRRMLREHAIQLQEALEFVRDKEEWGVKGFAHRGCLREAAIRLDPQLCEMAEELARAARDTPGRAFFLKRRMNDLTEQRRIGREADLVERAAEALQGSVVQLVRNPPLRGWGIGRAGPVSATSGHSTEDLVLNLACLVVTQGVQTFLAEVRRWNEAVGDQGLRLVASGPWPPYNFVPRFGNHAR